MLPEQLGRKIFIRRDGLNANSVVDISTSDFYQVSIQKFNLESEEFVIIQIQNVTNRVRFQKIKGEKNLL